MDKSPVNIIISGGGTGGHLFPGIAIAEQFKQQNCKNRILFAGTGNPFEQRVLKNTKFDLKAVSAMGFKGMGLKAKIRSLLALPLGMVDAFNIIREFRPRMVMGMGGYSSGPVILMARLMGVKTAIHEQNIIPGITNRILGHLVHRIYVSFEKTGLFAKNKKTSVTGNPVRQGFLLNNITQNDNCKNLNKSFTVLVTGGSQGAHSINLAIAETLPHLKEKNINFIHQTGAADAHITARSYEQNNMTAMVQPFFNNMDQLYKRANLIVCRAGATTIAEITAMGKAAIFIPYPFAADNHQESNAKALVEKNAAIMIPERDLSGKILAEKILFLSENMETLAKIETNSKKSGKPDAAVIIVNECCKLMEI